MKIIASYEKEIVEWQEEEIHFPEEFEIIIRNVDNPHNSFEYLLEQWIDKTLKKLRAYPINKIRNVQLMEGKIVYENFGEDYLDTKDVIEVNTVEELVAKMRELSCSNFYQNDDTGFWTICS